MDNDEDKKKYKPTSERDVWQGSQAEEGDVTPINIEVGARQSKKTYDDLKIDTEESKLRLAKPGENNDEDFKYY